MAEKQINPKHHLIMEGYLDVTTVETVDIATLKPHTAYTICLAIEKTLKTASAWTLMDALDLFSRIHGFDRDCLKLKRPFRPQRKHTYHF